jgi:hypothetical protein
MPLKHHEPQSTLPAATNEHHRAMASLIEELEAAQWYHERIDAADNTELKSILEHNRDEEVEHAAMLLEWLRRNYPSFDEQLKTYLFTDRPIVEVEEQDED